MTPRTPLLSLRFVTLAAVTERQEVPESQGERFSAFLERFDIGARTKEIATLLQEDPVVTKIHTQLVSPPDRDVSRSSGLWHT